jgi:two-component system invasion response regulator UvrY
MTRLIIADDHPLIRAGFRELAAGEPGIEVVGEAADSQSLLEVLRATPTDVVTLDISMPGPGFQDLIRAIRKGFPEVKVLVVSVYPEGELAIRALQAGAAGYVTKNLAPSELVAAIRKVQLGGRFVTPALAEWLAVELEGGLRPGSIRLSPREERVLVLLAEGKSYKETAAALGISPKTIGTYRSRILRKLKLKTTADLVRYAAKRDLAP